MFFRTKFERKMYFLKIGPILIAIILFFLFRINFYFLIIFVVLTWLTIKYYYYIKYGVHVPFSWIGSPPIEKERGKLARYGIIVDTVSNLFIIAFALWFYFKSGSFG